MTEHPSKGLKYTDVMKAGDISIAYLWTVFAGAVLSPRTSERQRQDMRKAFFAGFLECFKVTSDISTELSEAEAFRTLDRLHKECNEFFEKMADEHFPEVKP